MNIDPQLWGREAWNLFYYIALSYPKNPSYEDKNKYKNYFVLAGQVIPCDKCKQNFGKHLEELPIEKYLDTSYNLFTWVTKMENKVRILSKRSIKTVDENIQKYMNSIKGNNDSLFTLNLTKKEKVLIGLICVVCLLYLIKRFKH